MEEINNHQHAKGKNKLHELNSKEILEYLNSFSPDHKFIDADEYKLNIELIELYLSKFPAGYIFDPSDDILICDYLVPKIRGERLPINLMHDVSLYCHEPDYFVKRYSRQGPKGWYFFTPRDKKYPNGTRPARHAGGGYWKATGADKFIYRDGKHVGLRKALVYHKGRPPKGEKTYWIMHEFRTPDPPKIDGPSQVNAKKVKGKGKTSISNGDAEKYVCMRLGDSVLCRIYEKKPSASHIDNTPLTEVVKEVEPVSDVSTDDKISPPIKTYDDTSNNVVANIQANGYNNVYDSIDQNGDANNQVVAYNAYNGQNQANMNNNLSNNWAVDNQLIGYHDRYDDTSNNVDANGYNVYDSIDQNGDANNQIIAYNAYNDQNQANMNNNDSNNWGIDNQVNGYRDRYGMDQILVGSYNKTSNNEGVHNQAIVYNIDHNRANLNSSLDADRPHIDVGPKNEIVCSTSHTHNIPAQAGASTVDGFAANDQFVASTSFSSGMDVNHHYQFDPSNPLDGLDFTDDFEDPLNCSYLRMDDNAFWYHTV